MTSPTVNNSMPSLRLDLVEGRGEEDIPSPLEASHKAPNAVFGIPTRDRYQVVHDIGAGISSYRPVVFGYREPI